MKKLIILTVLIAVIVLGTVLVKLTTSNTGENENNGPTDESQNLADWPVYSFAEMMREKVDVVAIVTVVDSESKGTTESEPSSKLATLKVDKLLYERENNGHATREIKLNQAFDYVQLGESYLIFAEKNGEYYYEVSGNALIKAEDGVYYVGIDGIEGFFDIAEFEKEFMGALNHE